MDSKPITFWSVADYMEWNGIYLSDDETYNAILDIASYTELEKITVKGDEVPLFVLEAYFGGYIDS